MRQTCSRVIHRDRAQEQEQPAPGRSTSMNAETQAPGRSTSMNTLNPVIAQHIAAVNAFDTDAIVSTFAEDAFVNDVHREFWGMDAIRRWVEKEVVGDKVTIEVRDVIEHSRDHIVRGAFARPHGDRSLEPGSA